MFDMTQSKSKEDAHRLCVFGEKQGKISLLEIKNKFVIFEIIFCLNSKRHRPEMRQRDG